MLIISEHEFLREIAEPPSKSITIADSSNEQFDNQANEIVMENPTYDKFRKPAGIPNIPTEVKSVIASLASTEPLEDVSDALAISKDTVGNLANDNHGNALVKAAKANVLERLRERTIAKVDLCVEFLEVCKEMPRKELLATAESLSRIHRNMNGNDKENEVDRKTQFVFYIPEANVIPKYEIIDSPVPITT